MYCISKVLPICLNFRFDHRLSARADPVRVQDRLQSESGTRLFLWRLLCNKNRSMNDVVSEIGPIFPSSSLQLAPLFQLRSHLNKLQECKIVPNDTDDFLTYFVIATISFNKLF